MKRAFFGAFLAFFSFFASAKTWLVGPSKTYKKPSQVAALVAAGDSVVIDAGIYESDVCAWFADDLTLIGASSDDFAHLRSNGLAAEQKAIWVIKGTRVRVENIEFSGCKVPDQNGAGIRAEGKSLTVSHCFFHDNENGILTSNDPEAEFVIEKSRFEDNGFGDGASHNVYVGKVKSLVFRFNWSRRSNIGHLLKSRAVRNLIFCNRLTSESGPVSREIDLPNGGQSVVVGNLIQQPSDGKNGNIIGYGLEGLSNAGPHELFVCQNTIVNERFAGSFVQVAAGTALVKMWSNLLVGAGQQVVGTPDALDLAANVAVASVAEAFFFDPTSFDYRLTSASPALGKGKNAGIGAGEPLFPTLEYAHPISSAARPLDAWPDAGAFEKAGATRADDLFSSQKKLARPLDDAGQTWQIEAEKGATVQIFDALGRLIFFEKKASGAFVFAFEKDAAAGVFFLFLEDKKGQRASQKIWFR